MSNFAAKALAPIILNKITKIAHSDFFILTPFLFIYEYTTFNLISYNLRGNLVKKILNLFTPTKTAAMSLLIVTAFFRVYLYIYTNQVVDDFKKQNYKAISSGDTLNLTTRLNAFSSSTHWVCIYGSINGKKFYNLENDYCRNSFIQQRAYLKILHANNIQFDFTLRFPKEVEVLFLFFLILLTLLLIIIIRSTRYFEEEKRKHEINLSKLARQMSHDIRSPLATLNTIIDDISSTINNESHELIQNSLRRINEISNKHLENSQHSSMSASLPKLEENNIIEGIKKLITLKKIEFKNISIKLSFKENSEIYTSKVDIIEFDRIISNIINNSVEASATNIEVELESFDSSFMVIKIKDNGRGVSENIIKKLGISEISTKIKGNGLGIFHAKESIENWGGNLFIESIVNSFTEIRIVLPFSKDNKHPLANKLTILLDDDELVRLTWEYKAKKHEIKFKAYKSYDDLKKAIDSISVESMIYIDSELGDQHIKGEEVAVELNKLGFMNLYIASGNEAEKFKNFTFLKGIQSKAPPW